MKEIDAEFIGMSEKLIRSLKHFGERLDNAVSEGNISTFAAEKLRVNMMELASASMLTTNILAKITSRE